MKKSIFGGTLFVTSMALLVACGNSTTTGTGGDDDDDTDHADAGTADTSTTSTTSEFIGTWTLTTGSGTATCAGETSPVTLGATITYAAGTAPNTIIQTSTATGGTCITTYDISGNAGTVAAGSGCNLMYTNDNGVAVTEQRTDMGSISITGSTLTINIGGTDDINGGGETEDCTVSANGTYTKVGN